jgi:hypothetical protein
MYINHYIIFIGYLNCLFHHIISYFYIFIILYNLVYNNFFLPKRVSGVLLASHIAARHFHPSDLLLQILSSTSILYNMLIFIALHYGALLFAYTQSIFFFITAKRSSLYIITTNKHKINQLHQILYKYSLYKDMARPHLESYDCSILYLQKTIKESAPNHVYVGSFYSNISHSISNNSTDRLPNNKCILGFSFLLL